MIPYINQRYFKLWVTTTITIFAYSNIIPGIFLIVLLIAALPLVLLDNCSIIESLTKSSKMVWGNWWRIFAIICPFILIHLSSSDPMMVAFQDNDWNSVAIIGTISTVISSMFYTAALVIFAELKEERKEPATITIDI